MRVVVNEFMSLDGVSQAPGGPEEDTDGGFAHGGWSMPYFDPEVMGAAIGEGMSTAEALLFGRRTWQGMAAAWPERAGDPFADQMNAIPKYVASRTLTPDDLTWNTTLLSPADAVADIAALRARDGGDLLIWGSVSLVRTLLAEGPGRRAQPDDRADRARRRQADLPRGRHGAADGARQVGHRRHRRAGLHVPPGVVGRGNPSRRPAVEGPRATYDASGVPMKRITIVISVLVGFAMLVAACGSGSGGSVDERVAQEPEEDVGGRGHHDAAEHDRARAGDRHAGADEARSRARGSGGHDPVRSWTATPWRRHRAPPRARASGRRSPSPGARSPGSGLDAAKFADRDRCERRPGHVRRASALPVRRTTRLPATSTARGSRAASGGSSGPTATRSRPPPRPAPRADHGARADHGLALRLGHGERLLSACTAERR